MLRVTFRSLWEHKRRLISTVVAIVLGVAFMAGTFVLTDTLDQVFDDLFADANDEIATQVQGEVRVCPGRYRIADPSERGVIVAASSGTRIDLTGVVLESGDSVPARFTGIGVAVKAGVTGTITSRHTCSVTSGSSGAAVRQTTSSAV